jgi:NTE family protein
MTEKNGEQGLQVQAEQKSYAPPIVRPLILIDGSDYNNVLFSIGARITFLDLGSYRSELRTDAVVGSQYLLDGEYYHPFKPTSFWFVAPRGGVNSQQYNVYSGSTLEASYRIRQALGGLDIGYTFGRIAEFRLGYEGGWERLSPEIGIIPDLPTTSGPTGDARIQFQVTTLDNPVVPQLRHQSSDVHQGLQHEPCCPQPFSAH